MQDNPAPLNSLDEWEDDLLRRYVITQLMCNFRVGKAISREQRSREIVESVEVSGAPFDHAAKMSFRFGESAKSRIPWHGIEQLAAVPPPV